LDIDLGAAYDLIDYLAKFPIGAIAFLGSTGEFLHFDFEQRSKMLERVVRRSRVPVIANVSHSTLAGSLTLAQQAAGAGAAALLLMPPYFFRYSPEEVGAFYRRFRDSLRASIPLILYNIPFFTSELPVDSAIALLRDGGYAGIKDSSGSWSYFEKLLHAGLDGRTLLVGNDRLFVQGRSSGAHGGVSGVACALPELMTALDRAFTAGDLAAVNRLEPRLMEFIEEIERFPAPLGVREATALRGIQTGPCANPLGPESAARLDRFRGWFRDWLPHVQRECAG
jgi:dihydrodipicolinate synthase/N-acetylneuraminate lyase